MQRAINRLIALMHRSGRRADAIDRSIDCPAGRKAHNAHPPTTIIRRSRQKRDRADPPNGREDRFMRARLMRTAVGFGGAAGARIRSTSKVLGSLLAPLMSLACYRMASAVGGGGSQSLLRFQTTTRTAQEAALAQG